VTLSFSITAKPANPTVRDTIWVWEPGEQGVAQGFRPAGVAVNPSTNRIYVANGGTYDNPDGSVSNFVYLGFYPSQIRFYPFFKVYR
jgi:DNA-binding beta-propeller fold protein YncE